MSLVMLFFQGRLSEKAIDEDAKKYHEKYRDVLGINAGRAINMGRKSWRSFFGLLKAKEEDRLPPFIKKVRLPGYWKDRDMGRVSRGSLLGAIGTI